MNRSAETNVRSCNKASNLDGTYVSRQRWIGSSRCHEDPVTGHRLYGSRDIEQGWGDIPSSSQILLRNRQCVWRYSLSEGQSGKQGDLL